MSQQKFCLPQKKPVGRQPICSEQRIKRIDPVWCPGSVPPHFWEDEKNRRNYLLWLGHRLRFHRMDQWYSVTGTDFTHNHGGGILCYHRGSPLEMLRSLFPDYDWCEWLFTRVPHGFWDSPENQRRFIEWLGRELGVCRWEDWYQVESKDVLRHGGEALLSRYDYSLPQMMSSLFPEHDWKPWLFARVSSSVWDRRENRRRYMRWLGEQLGFRKPEDWYRATCRDFRQHLGGKLLAVRYHGSIVAAVTDAFPDYPWEFWELKQFKKTSSGSGTVRAPNGFWTVRANRLRYLRWLGRQLGFDRPADWYQVTVADFNRQHGAQCLGYYQSCLAVAAMDLHPKYPWKEWLFPRVPFGFWRQPENRRRYMHWLGEQLGFRRPEDWYRVRCRDFSDNHGGRLLCSHSLRDLLREFLPNLDWEKNCRS